MAEIISFPGRVPPHRAVHIVLVGHLLDHLVVVVHVRTVESDLLVECPTRVGVEIITRIDLGVESLPTMDPFPLFRVPLTSTFVPRFDSWCTVSAQAGLAGAEAR